METNGLRQDKAVKTKILFDADTLKEVLGGDPENEPPPLTPDKEYSFPSAIQTLVDASITKPNTMSRQVATHTMMALRLSADRSRAVIIGLLSWNFQRHTRAQLTRIAHPIELHQSLLAHFKFIRNTPD